MRNKKKSAAKLRKVNLKKFIGLQRNLSDRKRVKKTLTKEEEEEREAEKLAEAINLRTITATFSPIRDNEGGQSASSLPTAGLTINPFLAPQEFHPESEWKWQQRPKKDQAPHVHTKIEDDEDAEEEKEVDDDKLTVSNFIFAVTELQPGEVGIYAQHGFLGLVDVLPVKRPKGTPRLEAAIYRKQLSQWNGSGSRVNVFTCREQGVIMGLEQELREIKGLLHFFPTYHPELCNVLVNLTVFCRGKFLRSLVDKYADALSKLH